MEDDPVMRMYETQAIAEEKQMEINKLEAEKGELERKIRQLELEKSTVADKLDDVWAAINKLQKETRESGDNVKEAISNSARLQQKNEEKFEARMEAIKRQITGVNDLLAQSLLEMNKFNEETHSLQKKMKKDLTEQIKRNTDQAGSLQLQISKDVLKVEQIQGTITNQGKRFVLIDTTVNSSSQHMKLKTILVMGGADETNNASRTMTVLSTDRSDWIELLLELPYHVVGSGAVFLHNELYVVGGYYNPKVLYKLDKNLKWKRLAEMNVGRRFIANSCLEVNGYIWVFGGMDTRGNRLRSVERYDPKKNRWTLMPEMSTARADAAAVFCKDRIIVSGGYIEKERMTRSAECFLLETGEWTQFPPLPDHLGGHSLVSYENKLILMGGASTKYEKSVREMDPLQPKDGWKSLPPMKYSSVSFPGLVLDQEIYAVGGRGVGPSLPRKYTPLDRVEIFDGKSWRDGPSLPYQRQSHSAVVIPQSLVDRLCRQYKPLVLSTLLPV